MGDTVLCEQGIPQPLLPQGLQTAWPGPPWGRPQRKESLCSGCAKGSVGLFTVQWGSTGHQEAHPGRGCAALWGGGGWKRPFQLLDAERPVQCPLLSGRRHVHGSRSRSLTRPVSVHGGNPHAPNKPERCSLKKRVTYENRSNWWRTSTLHCDRGPAGGRRSVWIQELAETKHKTQLSMHTRTPCLHTCPLLPPETLTGLMFWENIPQEF